MIPAAGRRRRPEIALAEQRRALRISRLMTVAAAQARDCGWADSLGAVPQDATRAIATVAAVEAHATVPELRGFPESASRFSPSRVINQAPSPDHKG